MQNATAKKTTPKPAPFATMNPTNGDSTFTNMTISDAMLRSINEAGTSFLMISHVPGNQYLYISPSIKPVTGYLPPIFMEKGPGLMRSLYHPDEADFIRFVDNEMAVFFALLPAEEKLRYRCNYALQFKRSDDQYICLLCQVAIIETDAKGNPVIIAEALTDITRFYDRNIKNLSIRKIDNASGFSECIFSFNTINGQPHLSVREKEIYQLIREGRTSKEIGERLHLSKHTVDTHRRKIRKKMKTSQVSQLQCR